MIRLLQQEITSGLARRGVQGDFGRFCSYAGGKLNATARSSGSELTGNCRLRWYDHMLRNPVSAPSESEAFTRQLHMAVLDPQQPLALTLAIAAEKLDLGRRKPRAAGAVASPREALEAVKQALADAQLAYLAALAPLTKSEIQTLQANLYPILTSQNNVGHTLQNRSTGRRLCDLMELKLDRNAMLRAAEALAPISNRPLLEQLQSISADDFGAANETATAEGVAGDTVARIDTPSGAILIGGQGQNTYQLDKMPGVSVVIDLGGNDTYLEGSVSPQRPVLVVIDLDGNDVYRGSKPGIQGGAILGVSMLLDLAGDDVYQAVDVAQGSSIAGVGILIDFAGNDRTTGCGACRARPSAGWASSSIATATTTITPPCGPRASAARWASACSTTSTARTTTTAAACS